MYISFWLDDTCFAIFSQRYSKAHCNRYVTGLEKLSESEQLISDLQEELRILQPRLVQTSANTEALMVKIEQDTVEVEKTKEVGNLPFSYEEKSFFTK